LSTQYCQIKSICAVNGHTLEFDNFSYLVLLSPVLLVTNKYSNDQQIERQMNFSKHANSKYESSLTNANSLFSFIFDVCYRNEKVVKMSC